MESSPAEGDIGSASGQGSLTPSLQSHASPPQLYVTAPPDAGQSPEVERANSPLASTSPFGIVPPSPTFNAPFSPGSQALFPSLDTSAERNKSLTKTGPQDLFIKTEADFSDFELDFSQQDLSQFLLEEAPAQSGWADDFTDLFHQPLQ